MDRQLESEDTQYGSLKIESEWDAKTLISVRKTFSLPFSEEENLHNGELQCITVTRGSAVVVHVPIDAVSNEGRDMTSLCEFLTVGELSAFDSFNCICLDEGKSAYVPKGTFAIIVGIGPSDFVAFTRHLLTSV